MMSPSAADGSGRLRQLGVGEADFEVGLVGEPLGGGPVHPDGAQHAGREVLFTRAPAGSLFGELDDQDLEVGRVMAGPDLLGTLRRSRRRASTAAPLRWRRPTRRRSDLPNT